MAEGIISAMEDPGRASVVERDPERRRYLAKKYGVRVAKSLEDLAADADIIFLAVRPQDVADIAAVTRGLFVSRHTIVSIVAGKKLCELRKVFGEDPCLVRVMPNLCLRAKAGMCAICAGEGVKRKHLDAIIAILGGAGETIELDERHFDAVTALSGSGPAYFAYMEKAMAEAGVKLGLPPEAARLLAGQTMYGTAKFLRESGVDLGEFISGVATKGGTTAAGLEVLEKSDFGDVVASTLSAAAKRSEELG